MRKPLVPVDGSESATRALLHALAELRGRAGVELHPINVQTPPVHAFPGKLVSPDLIDQELRRQGEALLEDAEISAGLPTIVIQRHVCMGRPADEIAAVPSNTAATPSSWTPAAWAPWRGLLLGSVATNVVRLARLPVTLVK